MLQFLLFALMLFFMLMRVYMPLGVKVLGKVDKIINLSLPERTLAQRVNVYSIGFVLLIMALAGVISGMAELGVIVIALLILALPMRCLLTNQGIGINKVVFRPWSDFTSFRIESRRIVLIGKSGTRSMSLSVLATHQKELIPVLRRHLSEAKDGKAVGARRRQAAGPDNHMPLAARR